MLLTACPSQRSEARGAFVHALPGRVAGGWGWGHLRGRVGVGKPGVCAYKIICAFSLLSALDVEVFLRRVWIAYRVTP